MTDGQALLQSNFSVLDRGEIFDRLIDHRSIDDLPRLGTAIEGKRGVQRIIIDDFDARIERAFHQRGNFDIVRKIFFGGFFGVEIFFDGKIARTERIF